MRRLAAFSCIALALAPAAAGCGDSDSESGDFPRDYNAAIAKLDQASAALATPDATRNARSSRAIARQLDRFAGLLAATGRDLASLKPPVAARDEFSALRGSLDDAIAAARRAARAARRIQPARQRAALRELRAAVAEIARTQDALQRAIGTD